jgi:hypothetical protein
MGSAKRDLPRAEQEMAGECARQAGLLSPQSPHRADGIGWARVPVSRILRLRQYDVVLDRLAWYE